MCLAFQTQLTPGLSLEGSLMTFYTSQGRPWGYWKEGLIPSLLELEQPAQEGTKNPNEFKWKKSWRRGRHLQLGQEYGCR